MSINKFKKILIFSITIFLMALILTPCFAGDDQINVWGPTDATTGNNAADYIEDRTGLKKNDPRIIASRIISIAISFLGLIAVIIVLIGGFKWMTAGGNEDQVAEAKKWMYSGVVGLLIILAAYALANFVLNQIMQATG
ncbi:MAG: hypothetical protein V1860_01975 [bacterium]